jgi:hypothetical protein
VKTVASDSANPPWLTNILLALDEAQNSMHESASARHERSNLAARGAAAHSALIGAPGIRPSASVCLERRFLIINFGEKETGLFLHRDSPPCEFKPVNDVHAALAPSPISEEGGGIRFKLEFVQMRVHGLTFARLTALVNSTMILVYRGCA